MKISLRALFKFDYLLLGAVFLLLVIGLISIYSVGLSDIESKMIFFDKQLLFAVTGMILLFVFSFIDYRFLKSYYKIFLIISFLLLISVLIFGAFIRGTSSWFSVLGFQFQPVEFAKIGLIIFLAAYLSNRAKEFYNWKPILISALISFAMIALVIIQPDLGSAIILFVIWFIMLLFTNINKKKIIIIFIILAILISAGWFVFLKGYQKDRIITFLNPEKDPLGVGYNLSQSIIAVGSGGLAGRGFGLGSQSQLNFLPEQRTDFVFAVISEEFGFLGSFFIILIIIVFLLKILNIIRKSNDNFAVFLALGFLIMFFTQSLMNIAMNVGLAPVIGLPLPFISYGGSSLLMSLIAVGILESVVVHRAEYG